MSRLLAGLIAALTVLLGGPAHAAWGERDCTFGADGVQTLPGFGIPLAASVLADGNLLVRSGFFELNSTSARMSPAGALLPMVAGSHYLRDVRDPTDVSLGTGQILMLIGDSGSGDPGVKRLLANGNLDTTFGAGGYATMDNWFADMAGPIVQPDGRILIGGWGRHTQSFVTSGLARFNADGAPDLSFGSSGIVTNPNASAYMSIALQADGKILGLAPDALWRHLPDGQVDLTFGSSGKVAFPAGITRMSQVRIQPSGKILVAASADGIGLKPLRVTRYDVSGAMEMERDVTINLPSGQEKLFRTTFNQLHLLPDGRPVFIGALRDPGVIGPSVASAIVRMNADLSDDVGAFLEFFPTVALTLPSGKMVVGSYGGLKVRGLLGDSDPATCTATTTTVSSAPNPTKFGDSVTITASVTAASNPPATGSVQFQRGRLDIGAPVALSGGSASLSTNELPTGTSSLKAVYLPTGVFLTSTAAADHVVTPTLALDDPTANSALGPTTLGFTVTLSGALATPATVTYATSDRTATAGVDYTATSGALTFNPGETNKQVTISVMGQGAPSTAKDFFLTLSSPTNAVIGKGTGLGTIVYAAPGTLSIYVDDPQLLEGYSGLTLMGFTASLSQPHTSQVRVDYTTADGTALAGTDFTGRSGTLTFQPGQTQQWVIVPVLGNATVQANRSFFVILSNASAGVIAKSQGTGTILDDDPPAAGRQVPVYRLYSDVTKEHLYTTDANEYAVLPTRGWVAEGIAYTMFQNAGTHGGQTAIPLYRLYHPGIVQHHWTTDANEVMVLVASGYWQYERIPGYVLPSADMGSTPLYRLMYANPPLHLWTTDLNEKNVLSTQYGWVYEGVVGEVLP